MALLLLSMALLLLSLKTVSMLTDWALSDRTAIAVGVSVVFTSVVAPSSQYPPSM
jgi:hypothetical protein